VSPRSQSAGRSDWASPYGVRYSARDMAIARLIKRLLDVGLGIDAVGMLKMLGERDVRQAGQAGDERLLCELALRILFQRKAFREETPTDEEHYPQGMPAPPPPPKRPPPPPPPPHRHPRDA
jgi:hypothetical protein